MVPGTAGKGEHGSVGGAAGGEATTPTSTRSGRLRPRQRQRRQPPEGAQVTVPVAFSQHLAPEHAAFLLAEVLRHVLFMRGQLPMPYHELLKTLKEREDRDAIAGEERATKLSDELRASQLSGETRRAAGTAATVNRRRVKGGRLLAKATAHRRARKTLQALEETTLGIEQAFADASSKGRPVLEALILLGASHLSPREIYSVTFPEPPVGTPGDLAGDGARGGLLGKKLEDAYSRKLVRCLVGGMSSVTFRGLGVCRVHLFLRAADAPVGDRRAAPSGTPTTAVAATSACAKEAATTATSSSCAGVNDYTAAAGFQNSGGSSAALRTTTLLRLTPRPHFKIRTSRARPPPKVYIVLSKRPAPNNQKQTNRDQNVAVSAASDKTRDQEGRRPNDGGCAAAVDAGETRHRQEVVEEEEGGGERGGAVGMVEERGVWHQLVCARLAGLKGCESLAS